MPRYYFHVHHTRAELDELGTEFRDDDAARRAAVRTFGEIMRDLGNNFLENPDWRMIVVAEYGEVLFILRLSSSD